MAWASPQHSKTEVDRAGDLLLKSAPAEGAENADVYLQWWDTQQSALEIVNNWRSSHSFPLNTLQIGLRRLGRQVTPHALVAQRIKRLSSIEAKLIRFPTMKLSQMQDIGGCRGILPNAAQVLQLVKLFKNSKMKHALYDVDDYIASPQRSGYRGVHLKYRYFSDKRTTYNGLRIEIQLRSQLQHAWATAVETVGTFIRQALKSSQGEKEWLQFFALMGSALAHRERTTSVPDTPVGRQLTRDLRRLAKELNVESRLGTYGAAIQTLSSGAKDAHYYLLKLDPAKQQVTVTGYAANELDKASREYLRVEKEIQAKGISDAVLVSVDSVDALRRAYPNYFLDTGLFIDALDRALRMRN
jgi:hypothetical protein